MPRGLIPLTIAVAVAGALAIAACDDGPKSHVYVASLYEPSRDCLDPSASLATIPTANGSLECAPTCLVAPAPPASGAEQVYVSTMCGPYPANLDTSQTDPACALALAAWARGPDTCNAGGGSTNPATPPGDGGDEAASGDDGSSNSETGGGDDGGDGSSAEASGDAGGAIEAGGDDGGTADAPAE